MGRVISIEGLLRKRREAAPPGPGFVPEIGAYDVIAISTSAGKDSLAMMDYVVTLAREAGVADRIVAIHSDLGEVEWPGTKDLAAEHAAHYGIRYMVVTRIGGIAKKTGKSYKAGDVHGDILDYAERRGAFPSPENRWCTSDFKRGPIKRAFTALAKEWKAANPKAGRPCRILDCIGMRAEESPKRAKLPVFEVRIKTSAQHVDTWLPIHHWLTPHVWARIKASGARHHRAYDLGMPRLSCVLCIYAPREVLMLAGKHNREVLDRYVEVERKTGYRFRNDLALEEIRNALDAGEEPDAAKLGDGAWGM